MTLPSELNASALADAAAASLPGPVARRRRRQLGTSVSVSVDGGDAGGGGGGGSLAGVDANPLGVVRHRRRRAAARPTCPPRRRDAEACARAGKLDTAAALGTKGEFRRRRLRCRRPRGAPRAPLARTSPSSMTDGDPPARAPRRQPNSVIRRRSCIRRPPILVLRAHTHVSRAVRALLFLRALSPPLAPLVAACADAFDLADVVRRGVADIFASRRASRSAASVMHFHAGHCDGMPSAASSPMRATRCCSKSGRRWARSCWSGRRRCSPIERGDDASATDPASRAGDELTLLHWWRIRDNGLVRIAGARRTTGEMRRATALTRRSAARGSEACLREKAVRNLQSQEDCSHQAPESRSRPGRARLHAPLRRTHAAVLDAARAGAPVSPRRQLRTPGNS